VNGFITPADVRRGVEATLEERGVKSLAGSGGFGRVGGTIVGYAECDVPSEYGMRAGNVYVVFPFVGVTATVGIEVAGWTVDEYTFEPEELV